MPKQVTCAYPICQRSIAIPAEVAPGKRLRCPHCQEVFPFPGEEAATRTLEQASPATATVPPVSTNACPETAAPNADANKATLTLDPQAAAKAKPAHAAPPPPMKIGRFEIGPKLGEGGFGIVYKAYDPQLDRAIALKVAKLGGDSEQRIKRFLREAKSAANLRHPHIVPLFDYGQDDDQFFLALAYIPGQSLDHVISELNAKKEKMDCRRAATLVRHLAEALAYAHGLGIVHRDIKPQNVMLDERGDPLLMDFGLAAREMDEKLTREGAIMGTAAYLAPEQYRGEPTAASDQYSLGVTLYELLTGETPFTGPPDVQIYNHLNVEPESPRKRNPAVTRDLETICLKCLEKDAAKRYPDCQALADELRRWLDGEPILARPIGIVERVRKWSARNPIAAMFAGAAAMLLVTVMVTLTVGIGVAWYFAMEAKTQEGFAVDEAKKAKIEEKRANKESEAARLSAKEEKKAREEEQIAREKEATLAVRIQFEHYFSTGEDRPDMALHGMAILLPKAARLKDQSLVESLRLHLGVWSGRAARLNAIYMHQEAVLAVALSADGKTALTGSRDGTARVWETATGKPIGPPLQHQGEVRAVALSPDGKTALTGSIDGTARLWETATGKPIGPPLQHQGHVVAVVFSADGMTALTGGNTTARLWDTVTGKPIGMPLQHQSGVVAVALSADGKTVLTGSNGVTGARLWEGTTGKPIGPSLLNHRVAAVALSADSKTALAGSGSAGRLWETATGKPIGPLLLHQDAVLVVALSPDGKTALTGSLDNTARLWETATGKPIGLPLQHQGQVDAVALSADGKTALTGSVDNTARLWETATGKPIGPLLLHQEQVSAVALSADGKTAFTEGWGEGLLWKVPQPIRGDPERIMLWTQVITGLEVDELTSVHVLDAATWQQRRRRLQELGGPPVGD